MKKILTVLGMVLLVPFAVSAHGGDGDTNGGSEMGMGMGMMESQLDHEEMEGLIKTFFTKGTLSETDADSMIDHMNELLGSKTGEGMVGTNENNGDHHNGEEMMGGGGMMGMVLFHGLVGVTSLVWLVAGILYLSDRRKRVAQM